MILNRSVSLVYSNYKLGQASNHLVIILSQIVNHVYTASFSGFVTPHAQNLDPYMLALKRTVKTLLIFPEPRFIPPETLI